MTQNSKKKDPLGYIMGVAVDCENVKKNHQRIGAGRVA